MIKNYLQNIDVTKIKNFIQILRKIKIHALYKIFHIFEHICL